MDEKEKKTEYHEFEFGEGVDAMASSSATDCTGVMWRSPYTDAEFDSYRDVYDFEPPEPGKYPSATENAFSDINRKLKENQKNKNS